MVKEVHEHACDGASNIGTASLQNGLVKKKKSIMLLNVKKKNK